MNEVYENIINSIVEGAFESNKPIQKVYIVKAIQGEYEDYREPIVKVFLRKEKAKQYVQKESKKIKADEKIVKEKAEKCANCLFSTTTKLHLTSVIEKPKCYDSGDYILSCKNQTRYNSNDFPEFIIEEHDLIV